MKLLHIIRSLQTVPESLRKLRSEVRTLKRMLEQMNGESHSKAQPPHNSSNPRPRPTLSSEVRFLLHPDWNGDFAPARLAIGAYMREFTAADPVQLLLWLPQDCQVARIDAENTVAGVMRDLALKPEQSAAMTILANGTTAAPDEVLKIAGITLETGGIDERETCRRSRELDLVCADVRRGELREVFEGARERSLVMQAVEDAKSDGSLDTAAIPVAQSVMQGWRHQLLTGATPRDAYLSLRALHVATAGKFNALLEAPLRSAHPVRPVESPDAGVLGVIDEPRLARITDDLDRDGYHVFPERLTSEQCDRLVAFARAQPVVGGVKPFDNLEQGRGQVATFDFREEVLLRSPDVQRLCIDPGLLRVSQAYLRCEPVLDLVSMWWSLPFVEQGSSGSGQLYHFDMDRPHFLKFFVYLTDVDDENGPHYFVRGSHRNPQRGTLGDRRFEDSEVAKVYDMDRDQIVFRAPRGTIFAEDTRGLHKGAPLRSGERLVFQLEYASTLFGAPFEVHNVGKNLTPEFREAVRSRRRTMARFALE